MHTPSPLVWARAWLPWLPRHRASLYCSSAPTLRSPKASALFGSSPGPQLSVPPSLGGLPRGPPLPTLVSFAFCPGRRSGWPDTLAWSHCTTLGKSAACCEHRTRGTSSLIALPARLSHCEISWLTQRACRQNTVTAGLDTAHWTGHGPLPLPPREAPRQSALEPKTPREQQQAKKAASRLYLAVIFFLGGGGG